MSVDLVPVNRTSTPPITSSRPRLPRCKAVLPNTHRALEFRNCVRQLQRNWRLTTESTTRRRKSSSAMAEIVGYEGAGHVSIATRSKEAYDLTLTVNGFSKSYAMTGWRLGYLAAPEAVAKAVDSIQSHSTANPCSFAQKGALAALKGDQQPIADMRDEFDMRRNYMFDRISKIPNVTAVKPQGAFYVLVNISQLGLTSQNFADRLLSKANVAVVPGAAFGDDRTVRLSYATSIDVIKKGLDRFQDFCRTL